VNAASGISQRADWRDALAEALAQTGPLRGGEADLLFLFASAAYAGDFDQLLAEAAAATRARVLIGCSGQGVIGLAREIEDEPALSLLALRLPGAVLRPAHITQADLERYQRPEQWHTLTGIPQSVNALLLFADPFTLDAERLLAVLSHAYPGVPLVGGMASGDQDRRQTHLFLNGDVYDHGAVALALGGAYMVRTIVSQGATPIGEPWIITGAEGQVIHTIARRPAYEVLVETLRELPAEMQARARGNLLVGLAMDEYQQEFRRGDFLIRNLLGVDRDSGVLVVSALPGVGQTVQFQIRDAAAASEDLHAMLGAVTATQGEQPVAALLCACNGRGVGLFGTPGHDARTLAERLGPIPVVGLFCNGEIGPVGSRNFLHGFTASIALVVPRESAG
jgi:small ligand-binding sensory domain FIST